jgi:hypothetical protein
MARAKPLTIGDRCFRTQGAATAFFSHILYQYRPGERVRPKHEYDLRALLTRHTEYTEKLGSGVAYFFVDRPDDPQGKPKLPNPGQRFWVCRTDGTKDDVSIGNCITQRKRG